MFPTLLLSNELLLIQAVLYAYMCVVRPASIASIESSSSSSRESLLVLRLMWPKKRSSRVCLRLSSRQKNPWVGRIQQEELIQTF